MRSFFLCRIKFRNDKVFNSPPSRRDQRGMLVFLNVAEETSHGARVRSISPIFITDCRIRRVFFFPWFDEYHGVYGTIGHRLGPRLGPLIWTRLSLRVEGSSSRYCAAIVEQDSYYFCVLYRTSVSRAYRELFRDWWHDGGSARYFLNNLYYNFGLIANRRPRQDSRYITINGIVGSSSCLYLG